MKQNAVTKRLISLSYKTKYVKIALPVLYLLFMLCDLFTHTNASDVIYEYVKILVICLIAWFGVRFVFRFQIKNPFYNEVFFNAASLLLLVVMLLAAIINIVLFSPAAFVFLVVSLSVVEVQRLRKENTFEK